MRVHVVSHTHWDREWYHPAERFRQRLVALIDELLEDLPGEGQCFLLDGQTIVVEDYLEIRPERASDLAAALRAGKLEAGPWFVLADELIPGGEGLVRNLLAGRRTLRALRAQPPPVLYCPDSFGHPAALPELALGFDAPTIVLWRGFGGARAPKGDTFWWTASHGQKVLLHHLSRSGYELGANIPADIAAARLRWTHVREEIAARSTTGLALLLNGADHHARQRDLDAALRALAEAATPDEIVSSSVSAFANDLHQRAPKELPAVSGELRDSYGYTWTLQGTLASRTPQKRRYARQERALVRDMEPWAALAAFYGRGSRRHLTNAAWRPLLLCQPHDTLCGCSVDQVARAMDYRLESVAAQAAGLREDAILDVIGHDRDGARHRRSEWKPTVLIRNRAPRARSGVAIVELSSWVADAPAGPGSAGASIPDIALPPAPKLAGVGPVQVLARAIDHERTEAPRAYPDNDEVQRVQAAVWVDDIPAYGLGAFALGAGRASARAKAQPVAVAKDLLSNGFLTMTLAKDGAVTLEQNGRTIANALEWESCVDVGDLYTPAIRERKLTPRLLATRVLHRGPWRGAIEQRWRLLGKEGRIDLRVRLVIDAETNWLRVQISGENATRDHRLRLRCRTDIESGTTVADAAFGTVEREPVNVPLEAAFVELPMQTAPLHRYVSLFSRYAGATLFSDGLTEYETTDGTIAVTLLRSVGELSRRDLPERPGNAGWPSATPEAQCIGPFEAEVALMLHGPRSPAVVDAIERAADDVLYPLLGETLRSALEVPRPSHGFSLEGSGLAFSAAKESDDGEWLVLRCVNLLDEQVAGSWRFGRAVREAQAARLDETPIGTLTVRNAEIPFCAPPRGIVTILAR